MRLTVGHTWDGVPVGADERVAVDVRVSPGGLVLSVDAPHHGDPAPPDPPGTLDGLWAHEVVEVFVVGRDLDDYTEVEVGPHGHQLVLRLRGVRRRLATVIGLPLDVVRSDGRWTARMRLPSWVLPEEPTRINAFAIHGVGDRRRYLCHAPLPGPAPDFHQPVRFPRLRGASP